MDYLKHLPVNIVASHTHYDKEGNSYSMGTSIAEKGKTKYTLFKVPGGGTIVDNLNWECKTFYDYCFMICVCICNATELIVTVFMAYMQISIEHQGNLLYMIAINRI